MLIESIKKTLTRLGIPIILPGFEQLKDFYGGLAAEYERIINFKNSVKNNIVPYKGMDPYSIDDYNVKYGIPKYLPGSDALRIDRIIEKANLRGFGGPDWIEEQLQKAGYLLYVHENLAKDIDPGTVPGELIVCSPPRGYGEIVAQWGQAQYGTHQYRTPNPLFLYPRPVEYEIKEPTWDNRTSGTANILRGITWNGTIFCTVGNFGTILTSPDGVTWTPQTSGTGNDLREITWNGTIFCTVGNSGTILTSPDGVTWTPQTSGTGNILQSITWNGTIFCTVGNVGTIFTSPDGVTWTPQTSGTGNVILGIIWNGTIFCVVGDAGTILTSPDGVTWTPQTSGTGNVLQSITWNGTIFCTVGNSGTILTSPDGVTWFPSLTGIPSALYDVIYNGNIFCVVGAAGIIITSDNLDNRKFWNYFFFLSPFPDRLADPGELIEMPYYEFDYLFQLVVEMKHLRNWCVAQVEIV